MALTFRHEEKETRTTRVTVAELDPELVNVLETEWRKMLDAKAAGKPDYDLVTEMGSSKEVSQTAAYARAWGQSRSENPIEKVEVRKLPPRRGDKENTLRLQLTKFNPNAPKLGRKPKTKTQRQQEEQQKDAARLRAQSANK